jgi:kynurenine 3-monooxygenase
MNDQKKIAITGGGLVGSLLAIYLQKRGYLVTVFERRPDLRKNTLDAGRSINLALSTRGLLALSEVGLLEIIQRIAIPMHGRMMHDIAGKLTFQPYGQEGQFINSVSRTDLNIALMNAAENLGAEFRFEHRCTNVDLDKTEITWTVNTPAANTIVQATHPLYTQKFDLIIGADGAFSAVRSALQFTDRYNFSQSYIEHGYKELHIPANNGWVIEPNALHIWPRESYMMIALPNPDQSFTCTLFLPFEGNPSFQGLKDDLAVKNFFESTFGDALSMMPTLTEDFKRNPTSSLVTMRCYPWVKNKTLLIGDAAHAVVPFYGQGMNAGFEDCRILNLLLDQQQDNWEKVLASFQTQRKPDTDAIAQLALDNFIEMRDLVADADFLLRKKIEAKLHALYPDRWIPQYTMVTFRPDIRYSEAYAMGQKQKLIMDKIMQTKGIEENWQTMTYEHVFSDFPDYNGAGSV